MRFEARYVSSQANSGKNAHVPKITCFKPHASVHGPKELVDRNVTRLKTHFPRGTDEENQSCAELFKET